MFLSRSLAEQTVGLASLVPPPAPDDDDAAAPAEEEGDGRYWRVRFASLDLGVLDAARGRLLTPRERRHLPA